MNAADSQMFDSQPGDTFGFETWVKFRAIGKGQIVYVLGKGRHVQHGEDFGEDNQNYSVRFQEPAAVLSLVCCLPAKIRRVECAPGIAGGAMLPCL